MINFTNSYKGSLRAAFLYSKTKRMRGGEACQEQEIRTGIKLLKYIKNMAERLIWLRLQVN